MNDERLAYNAEYLHITIEQAREVDRYMEMPMNQWPERLQEIAKAKSRTYGFCGEVMVASVAEYIKEQDAAKR